MRNALLLCLTLAACSGEPVSETFNAEAKAEQQAVKERAADAKAISAGFAPHQPAPLKTVSVEPPKTPAPGAILPPGDRQYRYIGRWAATPALCTNGAWWFRVRKLTTPGETKCELPQVAAVPSGYELTGTCRAKDQKTEQTLKLSFDERQRTMHIAGKSVRPIDLIYCGN